LKRRESTLIRPGIGAGVGFLSGMYNETHVSHHLVLKPYLQAVFQSTWLMEMSLVVMVPRKQTKTSLERVYPGYIFMIRLGVVL
ncbi:MAG: hypothetical protein JSU65_00790, partial [Candidatus Zixiibacteriota bacterium]